MSSLVLFTLAVSASAASLGLLTTESVAMDATTLAQAYAKEIPRLGPLMPKELLREHIRKDLMPRLMSTQDDRTAYELGLNVFEKLGKHTPSLVELHNKVEQGKKLSKHQANEISESNADISRDMQLLEQKVKEGTSSNAVSHQTLKLFANSVHGHACAVKATEIAILSKGKEEKKDCILPFPGSFIMLDQKIEVPQKVGLTMPSAEDVDYLKPQNWMSQHMRRMMWCKDSSEDSTCDAVSAALAMPRHDEIVDERANLNNIETAQAEALPEPAAMVQFDQVAEVSALLQQAQKAEDKVEEALSSADMIMKQVAENAHRSQEFNDQLAQVGKKLSLKQKRVKLAMLKRKLAEDKDRLASM